MNNKVYLALAEEAYAACGRLGVSCKACSRGGDYTGNSRFDGARLALAPLSAE